MGGHLKGRKLIALKSSSEKAIVNGPKRLVILGCGGFIGWHVLDHFLPDPTLFIDGWDPDRTRIGGHLGRPNFCYRAQKFDRKSAKRELEESIKSADVVINLAAVCNPAQYTSNPLFTIISNFSDLQHIVEMCSNHNKWLVHFSTSEVYGRTIASYVGDGNYSDPDLFELDEDTTPLVMGPISNQRWTYACAKQLLERLIFGYHKEKGLDYTIIRPFNFFGPRMDFLPGREGEGIPRVLACFMSALLDGKPLQLVDGGTARRSILSVHDAVRALALVLSMREKSANQIINLGSRENELSIAELADQMRRVYAKITGDPSYERHPMETISGTDFYGEGYEDCDRRMPKLDKARRLLGWEPRISLEEILIETMSYYHGLYGVSAEGASLDNLKTPPVAQNLL